VFHFDEQLVAGREKADEVFIQLGRSKFHRFLRELSAEIYLGPS